MEKPGSLRAAIAAYLPDLAKDPDALAMWVEKGRIRGVQGPSRAFTWEYTLTGLLKGFTGHPSLVWLAVNDWLAVNQPDQLAALGQGYRFEADILDDKTIDLQFELDLTEVVAVVPRDAGGFELSHLPTPAPLLDEETALSEPPALLRQLWWRGEQILP